MRNEWRTFTGGIWEKEINVRDFIQKNYTPYDGDETFLAGPTQNTKDLWDQVMELSRKEREAGGVLDMDTKIISTITSHGPGYLDKEKETIVGFQTDKPFKRSLQPYGGIRMAEEALKMYGYELSPRVREIFTKYRKTHNDGVFDAYTPEMRLARHAHILTGFLCALRYLAKASGISLLLPVSARCAPSSICLISSRNRSVSASSAS